MITQDKYPNGIIALSSIEMWERFSFYTMQSILVLYANAKILNGGLGWGQADALRLTGIYGSLVYMSPLLGGVIADKILGNKVALLLGAIIMMFGHISLAFHSTFSFFLGLILLIIGSGLLKPTITSMVGEFYTKEDKINKERAFAFFYMSINVGAILGTFISGAIYPKYGYSMAFFVAAFGLIIAIINFLLCRNKSLKNIGNLKNTTKVNKNKNLSKIEFKKFWVFIALCFSNILWNIIYALPYGLLTLYADKNISKTLMGFNIPTTWFYGMYGIFIIIFSPIMAFFYKFIHNNLKINFTLSHKLGCAYLFLAIACIFILPLINQISINHNYVGSPIYLILFYLFFAISELLTIPVLLSAATTFASKGWSSTLVSLNISISWGVGAYLGGEFGALTETVNPVFLFKIVIISCFILLIGHIFTNKKIEHLIAQQ